MSTPRHQCPVCHAPVTDWSARCPKCRYHPDCDDRDCYNRAQDDVALIVRSHARHDPRGRNATAAPAWRRFVPEWLRRPGVASQN